ncbi:hypothetical protein P4V41_07165 [Fictibacillus nanhaiensis]|uniref:hypothetical protein n=1 Tax=Fictibacillus nanhaiensis TaxID=742169 RepID=UPI002E1C5182|nr:hypothetical protein [Fictibacillus nanhaiensis]
MSEATKFKKYTLDISNRFYNDEIILRLLHYKPKNRLDDPLDPSKNDILSKDEDEKWDIIDAHIMTAPKISDLEKKAMCRLFIYPGVRRPTDKNFLFANQQFNFDVLTHSDFQNMDLRNEWICERVNELVFGQRIAGLGQVLFKGGQPINAPKDYQGYRLVYEFASENY